MNNNLNYDVNFQYDFDEDSSKNFSVMRIKKIMSAHGGIFVSDFSDYGIKDVSFTINTVTQSLKTIIETVLKEANRNNVKMTVFANKQFDLINLNIADVVHKEELFELIQKHKEKISFKKLNISSYDSNEISLELEHNTDKFESLLFSKNLLELLKVKNIQLDTGSVEVIKIDNYKNKQKNSFGS